MLDRAKALAARAIEHIKQKSLRYWVSATLVVLATFFGSERAYHLLSLGDLRARYFQLLMDHPGAPVPGYVSIALIDDKEYWSGPPGGRLPLKRDYLARPARCSDCSLCSLQCSGPYCMALRCFSMHSCPCWVYEKILGMHEAAAAKG
jgi:hypothetical protein